MLKHTLEKNKIPYPLKNLLKPPSKLFFQGHLSLFSHSYISIVGSRELCGWAENWMEQELFPVLKQTGVGVVSGGARGVDQFAHNLALRAGLPTIVVLPSGLRQKYPKKIETQLGDNKKVGYLSEYGDDEKMKRYHFIQRNRLIAGLSPLLFLVQAEVKSGSMMTAQYAIDQGKMICCLPGSPFMERFSGNLQLLYDGAQVIRHGEDLKLMIETVLKN